MFRSDMPRIYQLTAMTIGLIIVMLCFVGCDDQRVTSTLPATHPSTWMSIDSPNFHGKVALAGGTISCAECHGADLDGGDVKVSCVACHISSGACTSCHGGLDNKTGAPPYGLRGQSSDTSLAVGAHTIHLSGSSLAAAVPCESCHLVPVSIADSLHLDLNSPSGKPDSVAEIHWHGLVDSTAAVWDRNTRTCSGVYCHGNFDGGNTSNEPVWTAENQADCGSCHDVGDNPASLTWKHEFHVGSAGLKCAYCHAAVVDTSLAITNPNLHVNGIIDTLTADTTICNVCHGAGASSCTGCHGGVDSQTGAPPKGLHGEISTTSLAVGAHTSHLSDGTISAAVPCASCHVVPTSISSPGHFDSDSVAEITWGGISGSQSVWDRANATCASTYCHGNFDGGNSTNQPIWTASNQAQCGSCHDTGTNPSSLKWKHTYHVGVAGLACEDCHANVVDGTLNITDINLHINGVADTLTRDTMVCRTCHGAGGNSCTICHGGIDNITGAPPKGLHGETQTTQLAVGAHTRHVEGGLQADAFNCDECHIVPDSVFAPGHLGADSVAEITWGSLAGPQAAWNRINATCTNTYCHGNFSGGYASNAPVWTGTDQATCGSCHDVGTNPADLLWKHDTHVRIFNVACVDCHSNVVDDALNIISTSLHVNGVVDTLTLDTSICLICHGTGHITCTGCHGGLDNASGAPPYGLRGETATTTLAVGAHTAHLSTGPLTDAFACSECHIVPTTFGDPGHYDADSVAELTWGPLAGSSSSWNRTTAKCSGTYCHGNFSGGTTSNAPVWTGSNQAACGTCHDVGGDPSSLGGKHYRHVVQEGIACYRCHSATVNSSMEIVGKAVHVDGINTVSFSNGGSYSNGTCTGIACHGRRSW